MGFFEQVFMRVVAAVLTIIIILLLMHWMNVSCYLYQPQYTATQAATQGSSTSVNVDLPDTGGFSFNTNQFGMI